MDVREIQWFQNTLLGDSCFQVVECSAVFW
ncbi:hypothetical protein E2C01_098853 [Portunus trituberculatus]|uniref:Uncharacterized protein n=1 Tax=Portunus trituberculatus TaxID=210409 RepID=A0A5B7KD65_PORTR|nr:hypothetical protein [Portunus trituberculatus]